MSPAQATFYHLGVALVIGLLIGIERGWAEREEEEGGRVAGVRTFALIGILGGAAALLAAPLREPLTGYALVALGALLTVGYVLHVRLRPKVVSITTQVAALLTFVLGALATSGEVAAAAAAAVVVALLLSAKPELHRWLGTLRKEELSAGLQLLLLSVVILPLLPNQGYGPWEAINPYRIWWFVVLIAAVSFVGYFAVKEAGARRGTIYTGLFAGLSSSTALTLHFSRLARSQPDLVPMFALGILLACGTMCPRILLVVGIVAPAMVFPLLLPLGLMSVAVYGTALLLCWRMPDRHGAAEIILANPLALRAAIGFGLLLSAIMVLSKAVEAWIGGAGLIALAAASGIADVDAISLSLAGMTANGLAGSLASAGVVTAVATNCLFKAGLALSIGGRPLGIPVALPLVAAAAAGGAAIGTVGF